MVHDMFAFSPTTFGTEKCSTKPSTGELAVIRNEKEEEWKVNFSSLSDKPDQSYYSPPISFLDTTWYLKVLPNGSTDTDTGGSVGWIDVYLGRCTAGRSITLSFSLGLKSVDGKKYVEHDFVCAFEKKDQECGMHGLLERSELMNNKSTLAPSDVVTITCHLRHGNPSIINRTDVLSRDFRTLLIHQGDNDVTIRVGQLEFRANPAVLEARCPGFCRMHQNATRAEREKLVIIDDFGPDVIRAFLIYLYTAKVDKLNFEIAAGLYRISHKYGVPSLKDGCVEYLKSTVAIGTFCDFAHLAISYEEEPLIEKAADFFSQNFYEIEGSPDWKIFDKSNIKEAKLLYKKAFSRMKGKNTQSDTKYNSFSVPPPFYHSPPPFYHSPPPFPHPPPFYHSPVTYPPKFQ